MGKIRRDRQKFHITAENKNEINNQHEAPTYKNFHTTTYKDVQQASTHNNVQNIFAGINIQLEAINKFDEKTKPSIDFTSKKKETIKKEIIQPAKIGSEIKSNVPEKQLTKKEKMLMKREKFMQLLDVTQKARLQIKKKKKRIQNGQVPTSVPPMFAINVPLVPKVNDSCRKDGKTMFTMPCFKDDLPAFKPVLGTKSFQNSLKSDKIDQKSKPILKNRGQKNKFINSYNSLRRAMATNKTKTT